MAGNIKQAYIDSSLSYYHDLIARGVDLENIKIHIQSGAEHNEEALGREFIRLSSLFR